MSHFLKCHIATARQPMRLTKFSCCLFRLSCAIITAGRSPITYSLEKAVFTFVCTLILYFDDDLNQTTRPLTQSQKSFCGLSSIRFFVFKFPLPASTLPNKQDVPQAPRFFGLKIPDPFPWRYLCRPAMLLI